MRELALLFLERWQGQRLHASHAAEGRHAGAVGLLTTFMPGGRSGGHRVRRELIERQAGEAGLPLHPVLLPEGTSNAVYEAAKAEALSGPR